MRNLLFFELCLAFFISARGTYQTKQNNYNELVIEPIVGGFTHGEGPHWDHDNQQLYIIDIDGQNICRIDTIANDSNCIYIEYGPVGFGIPVKGEPDKLIAGSGTDFILVSWNGHSNYTQSSPQILSIVDRDRNGTRWNDGKVDSSGRFWGGTIGPEVNDVVVPNEASLYRIDSDLKPKRVLSPVTNSNGLAWNKQNNIFYYIDTPTLKVAAFNYEPINGIISNKTIAFDLKKNNVSGLPDGMTIDTNGNLWIALYNGGGVAHVNPNTGELLGLVKLPVKKVTSCTFGGPLLDILYVTTSSRGLDEEELEKEPYAGYVFAVHGLGVHGLVANSFKL